MLCLLCGMPGIIAYITIFAVIYIIIDASIYFADHIVISVISNQRHIIIINIIIIVIIVPIVVSVFREAYVHL